MTQYALGPVFLDLISFELDAEEEELLQHPQVGGVILFSRNYEERPQLRALTQRIKEIRPGIVVSVDHEGGRVQRFKKDFTLIPPMRSLGERALEDLERAEAISREIAWLMASELLVEGVDISFAPVLDLDEHRSDIIGDRAFCDDPELANTLAKAFIEGMQHAGMCATGKHFPGHGGVREDSHLELPIDQRSLEELESKDLLPFKYLAAQLDAIMPAHMLFPNIDKNAVGFSTFWLREYLRDALGFDGIIFSDDLNMAGASAAGGYDDRAQASLEAGCDAVLICNNRPAAIQIIEFLESRAKSNSHLPRKTLDVLHGQYNLSDIQALRSSQRWQAAQSLISEL